MHYYALSSNDDTEEDAPCDDNQEATNETIINADCTE